MFKFIKAKGPHQSAERQKLQKELFSYRRTLQHGFPHKPMALAWDASLRLICIGTATGAVKVYGRPGVEFYSQHQNPIPVTKVVFLPNQGRVAGGGQVAGVGGKAKEDFNDVPEDGREALVAWYRRGKYLSARFEYVYNDTGYYLSGCCYAECSTGLQAQPWSCRIHFRTAGTSQQYPYWLQQRLNCTLEQG